MLARLLKKKHAVAAGVCMAAVMGFGSRLFAQQEAVFPSVWDGVYTASQASRGEFVYRTNCASCHGIKLEGHGDSPALIGRDFTWDWDYMGIDNLFEKIMFTMADKQPQLTPARQADLVAYILKANRFPAGNKELPADVEELRVVLFQADPISK